MATCKQCDGNYTPTNATGICDDCQFLRDAWDWIIAREDRPFPVRGSSETLDDIKMRSEEGSA